MFAVAKKLFWSSRPVSWINTAFPFSASYLVVNGSIDAVWLVGTLYFLIPYNLLMYGVNDVFDFESDRNNPRKQLVEGVVVEKKLHRITLIAAIISNVPFLAWLALQGSAASVVVLAVVIFSVLAYSVPVLRFKERPFLDSVTSATHFVGPMVYGLVLAGWQPYFLIFAASFFFWSMASHAFGAVQDIVPDRRAGLKSVATFLGARWTVRLAIAFYAAACALLLTQGFESVLVGLLGVAYIINIAPFWNLTDKDSAISNRGWKRFIKLNYVAGFAITMLLLSIFL